MADPEYKRAFDAEVEAFKSRIRTRAKQKVQEAMQEYEEEERQKRLGPGGLDPAEVFESLPEVRRVGCRVGCRLGNFVDFWSGLAVFWFAKLTHSHGITPLRTVTSLTRPTCLWLQALQKCFESQDTELLQKTIAEMDQDEARYHMKRCVDSGLWVADAKAAEAEKAAKEAEEAAAEGAAAAEPVYEEVKGAGKSDK